jgi:hypothetical protein
MNSQRSAKFGTAQHWSTLHKITLLSQTVSLEPVFSDCGYSGDLESQVVEQRSECVRLWKKIVRLSVIGTILVTAIIVRTVATTSL